jgi:hypothetical protein
MPQFSIPDGSPGTRTFLSPRKSFVAVGIVCALSAAALWTGRAPAPTLSVDVDNATQSQVSMDAIQ